MPQNKLFYLSSVVVSLYQHYFAKQQQQLQRRRETEMTETNSNNIKTAEYYKLCGAQNM